MILFFSLRSLMMDGAFSVCDEGDVADCLIVFFFLLASYSFFLLCGVVLWKGGASPLGRFFYC